MDTHGNLACKVGINRFSGLEIFSRKFAKITKLLNSQSAVTLGADMSLLPIKY